MPNKVIELSPSDLDLDPKPAAIVREHALSDANSSVLIWATIAWGGSLAIIVGRDGQWAWILTRLAIVGVLLAALLWAAPRRAAAGSSPVRSALAFSE